MPYDKLANLPLTIESYELAGRRLETPNFTRHTTVIRLVGPAGEGLGEDITYSADNQRSFQERGARLPLAGNYTLEEFSHLLDAFELFHDQPSDPAARLHRRWGFESAALDLALRQADTTLAAALAREPRPVTYSVSTGLGDPPSTDAIQRVLTHYPDARFKVDYASSWDADFVAALAETGRIDVVDLKGHYRGAFRGPDPDPAQYRMVAEGLPEVWIEDPWLDDTTRPALADHLDRVTWDANLHSVADLVQQPHTPRCVNIKPSRIGFVSELMRLYDYCENRGIAMYGGGQFELDVGRGQIQYLASLFHPTSPNDVAPSAFNDVDLAADLPASPLAASIDDLGFRWR